MLPPVQIDTAVVGWVFIATKEFKLIDNVSVEILWSGWSWRLFPVIKQNNCIPSYAEGTLLIVKVLAVGPTNRVVLNVAPGIAIGKNPDPSFFLAYHWKLIPEVFEEVNKLIAVLDTLNVAVPSGQVETVLTLKELTGNTVIVALPVGANTHVFAGLLLSEKLDIV